MLTSGFEKWHEFTILGTLELKSLEHLNSCDLVLSTKKGVLDGFKYMTSCAVLDPRYQCLVQQGQLLAW